MERSTFWINIATLLASIKTTSRVAVVNCISLSIFSNLVPFITWCSNSSIDSASSLFSFVANIVFEITGVRILFSIIKLGQNNSVYKQFR
jgi:uncharacterized membrane protein